MSILTTFCHFSHIRDFVMMMKVGDHSTIVFAWLLYKHSSISCIATLLQKLMSKVEERVLSTTIQRAQKKNFQIRSYFSGSTYNTSSLTVDICVMRQSSWHRQSTRGSAVHAFKATCAVPAVIAAELEDCQACHHLTQQHACHWYLLLTGKRWHR